MSKILQVAVPTPLWQCFDYTLPMHLDDLSLMPGMRLKIPFGRQACVGILMGVANTSALPATRLKAIFSVLDEEPLISPSLLALCRWASSYYHHPIGEVLFSILPPHLRQEKKTDISLNVSENLNIEKKLNPIELNENQHNALTQITQAKDFSTFLLWGVTGSGKTEVYLRAIADRLDHGKQVLVLVPEIALTPQTIFRFAERFDVPIVSLHSNLSDKKRAQAWVMAQRGEAKIIIGTRSAVFAPMLNPGMIILDEEHDLSFKQQSGFRYSARDCAVMRAHIENIPIILGSATPSLESLWNTKRQRYTLLKLPERAGNAIKPELKIIDLRRQTLKAGMSEALLKAIKRHIDNQGQVMLFLNRRGYAPTLLCHSCGHITQCQHCDARLTLHQNPKRLFCHHCGASQKIPPCCPSCRQAEMIDVGLGTERLEEVLQNYYPDFSIIRIDRDSTRRKNSMTDKLKKMHDNEADILIGTQMIAKGHHFKNLTLVAIVDSDSGFFSADFRAIERMGQLLVQVSGRAGREEKAGEVLIQTHQPNNPLLLRLLNEGYGDFSDELLREREITQLPPYTHMALLRAESIKKENVVSFLNKSKEFVMNKKNDDIFIFGPIPAAMERKANRYRHQLLLQSKNRLLLQRLLSQLTHFLSTENSRAIRWTLDVDPQES